MAPTEQALLIQESIISLDDALGILNNGIRLGSLSSAEKSHFHDKINAVLKKSMQLGIHHKLSPLINNIIFNYSTLLGDPLQIDSIGISEEDIERMVAELDWEDIWDLYPKDMLVREEDLQEKLTAQARIKKGMSMRTREASLSVARKMKLSRVSTLDTLKKRSMVAARRALYKKMLMGRDKSTLSSTEKERLEDQLSRMKFVQAAIAVRMLPKIRQIEQKRLAPKKIKIKKHKSGKK